MASSRAEPGIRKPWISIPALLLLDALGLSTFGWAVSRLQEVDASLAMRADVVKIMVPSGFIMLFGAIFPIVHILGWLAVRARRLRKPVLGLREKWWWLIAGVLIWGTIPMTWVANWTVKTDNTITGSGGVSPATLRQSPLAIRCSINIVVNPLAPQFPNTSHLNSCATK